MSDPAALQEAIQRARQLAAKISQNAPVKRTASEMDDHSIGTVKVTLAYEKPPNSDKNKSDHRSSNYRDNNYNKDSNYSRDKDRDRDRDDRSPGNNGNTTNNNTSTNSNAYSRASNINPSNSGHSMLGGTSYTSGSADARIEIIIPHAVIGLVIGKGGENIKKIQNETGATVRVDPNTVDERGNKVCTITGTQEAVDEAHNQVSNVIENAANNKRPRTQVEGSDQYRMKIPASRTGAIIGKGGETIKSIKLQSGCDIELDKGAKECGPDESVFIIRGTQDKIQKARSLIEQRLASRGRDGDNSLRSAPKGLATGANAAPVAQFTDLPASYPAAGQQAPADVSAAWAAYIAQYSSLYSQAGAQAAGPAGMPNYAAQGLLGASAVQPVDQTLIPQAQPQQAQVPVSQSGQQRDYSDQWIEYYLMNGRADYAEMIIELKKQQQQNQQQQPPPPPAPQ